MNHTRLSSRSGLVIGVILFVLAIVAVISIAVSAGSNVVGTSINIDRVSAQVEAQGRLIKNRITECVANGMQRLDANYTNSAAGGYVSPYPASSGTGTLVELLDCPALSYNAWATGTAYTIGNKVKNAGLSYIAMTSATSGSTAPTHTAGTVSDGGVMWRRMPTLWENASPVLLPAPPQGFDKWYYVDAGDTNGRCIRIQPLSANAADPNVKQGLIEIYNSFTSTERVYDSNSASQRFILWITRPTGSASANCSS